VFQSERFYREAWPACSTRRSGPVGTPSSSHAAVTWSPVSTSTRPRSIARGRRGSNGARLRRSRRHPVLPGRPAPRDRRPEM